MQLVAGDKLGPYEIVALVGKGGMGEVYRAIDTRLNRPVAIKVSAREFSDRFEREARAIAALNHPGICTLYDVGPNYLVMEFVEGELLSKIIEGGPLPLDKALTTAIQIAEALAAAHARGIIHRDLKPGNIIITRNGAKVLDFGLAKLSLEMPDGAASALKTGSEPITCAGSILGTLYYMAPEQVEGKEAREQSDIFSFGIVLYEMITGQRPFTGDTQAAVMAAVLRDPPPSINHRQPAAPRALERVVRRCLEKKPEDRWHSARDLRPALELIDLDAPAASAIASGSVPTPLPAPARKKWWLWPVAALVPLIVIAALGWSWWGNRNSSAQPERATRFQVTLPEGIRFSEYVSLSPDGHKLLFNASGTQGGLWIRDLNTLQWRRLEGTDGAISPFWSPDSKYLAFSNGKQMIKIDLAGGPPQTLTAAPAIGSGTWNMDSGIILFGGFGAGNIRRIPATGGVPVDVTTIDASRGENSHALPVFLPDGKHFLYLRQGAEEIRGIYVGSIDVSPEQQSKKRIIESAFGVPFVDGKVFFMRGTTLMAQTFDADKLQLTGEPFPVVDQVGTSRAIAMFSVSKSGALAYREGGPAQIAGLTVWYDRSGKPTGTAIDQNPDPWVVLSPDGKRFASRDKSTDDLADIWLRDLERGVRTRFTFHHTAGSHPVWSADGARMYYSVRGNRNALFEKDTSGAGEARELYRQAAVSFIPTDVSSDGRFLLYHTAQGMSSSDVWTLPLQGEPKPVRLLGDVFDEVSARLSPDGRWLVYTSTESNRAEVYVRPFVKDGPDGPVLDKSKWQVSRNGGTAARWTQGGKEIVFRRGPTIQSVEVTAAAGALQLGSEKQLFSISSPFNWDVTADGQRFLITTPLNSPAQTQTPITVVLNWQAELKK